MKIQPIPTTSVGGGGGLYNCQVAAAVIILNDITVAQSVGHLTRKSGVLGSIPGLATYFRSPSAFSRRAPDS